MLTQRALDEYYMFGKAYKEEAQRILKNLPELPSKFDESSSEGGLDGPRVSANQMILALTKYINEVLLCSPLIPKLFFVRDFLTTTVGKESVETSFRTARELSMKDAGAQQMVLEVVTPNPAFLPRTSLNETSEVEEDRDKNMIAFVGESYSQERADSF